MQNLTLKKIMGFTLIEVLASVGILVAFLTAALVSFTSTQNLSANSQQQAAVLQGATAELEEIRARSFSNILDWYYADAGADQIFENRIFKLSDADDNVYAAGGTLLTDISNQGTNAPSFSGERAWHASFVYRDRVWVLGGRFSGGVPTNDIQRWNGAQWQTITFDSTSPFVTWPARTGLAAVVYNDDILVLGGNGITTYYNDVYLMDSADAANADPANDTTLSWVRQTASAQWTPRYGHAAVVFQNEIWVLGGYGDDPDAPGTSTVLNDIWKSADGISWTRVTTAAPPNFWSARANHTAVVFNNQLWIIGGRDANNIPVSDPIWYSSDGETWNELTPIKPGWATGPDFPDYTWQNRFAHAAAILEDKIWIVGGNLGGNLLNDMWWTDDLDFTADKQTWTRGTDNVWGAGGGRQGHTAVVYEGKIWLLGGLDAGGFSAGASWSYGAGRMYQVDIAVSWKQRSGRIVGEDNGGSAGTESTYALNGVLDASVGEDTDAYGGNNNSQLDSPVHIRGLIANRGSPGRVYLGRE